MRLQIKNRINVISFFFTTHKLIIADRLPSLPFKFGKYHLTGWGGDLMIPYDYIDEIETRQYKTLITRKNKDLSIVFKNGYFGRTVPGISV